jgi:type II secretory pathway pseudopilin PulG
MRNPRSTANRRAQAGFTFAEVLAALLFMGIVIPVTLEALSIASRAGIVAERKCVAMRLADSTLNELMVTGRWRSSGQSGSFPDPWRDYRWTTRNEPWLEANVRLVTIEVRYPAQGEFYLVRLSTLAPDTVQ